MSMTQLTVALSVLLLCSAAVMASDGQKDDSLHTSDTTGPVLSEVAQTQSNSCGTTQYGDPWPDAVCPKAPCPEDENWCVAIDAQAGDRYPAGIFHCVGEWYYTGQLCDQPGTKCVWGRCGQGSW